MEQQHLDAVYENNELDGFNMKISPLKAGDWDVLTPFQLAQTMAAVKPDAQPTVRMEVDKNGPVTYAFSTREGGMGIVQILGVTTNKESTKTGIKIRYKLVEHRPSPAAAAESSEAVSPAAEHKTTIVMKAWPGEIFSVAGEECDLDGLHTKLNQLALEQSKNRRVIPITIDKAKGVDKSQAMVIADALLAFGIDSPEVLAGKSLPLPASTIEHPRLQFREEAADKAEDIEILPEARGQNRIRLNKKVFLDEGDVVFAWQEYRSDGDREINLKVTVNGMRKLAAITDANLNRRFAILFDGRVLMAPVIRAAICSPTLTILGNLTDKEAETLLDALNRPKTTIPTPSPVPSTTGPTQGSHHINCELGVAV